MGDGPIYADDKNTHREIHTQQDIEIQTCTRKRTDRDKESFRGTQSTWREHTRHDEHRKHGMTTLTHKAQTHKGSGDTRMKNAHERDEKNGEKKRREERDYRG